MSWISWTCRSSRASIFLIKTRSCITVADRLLFWVSEYHRATVLQGFFEEAVKITCCTYVRKVSNARGYFKAWDLIIALFNF